MSNTETQLVPNVPAEIEVPPDLFAEELLKLKELAAQLPPRYAGDVLMLRRPFPQEMSALVAALPLDAQAKVMDLIRKTRPKKQGVHTARDGFTPPALRLFQGTGSDPLRPKNCLTGQYYTNESKTFETPFDAAVIMFYQGRTLWPGKDETTKNPLCISLDRKMGSRYGACDTCPKAGAKYSEGGCGRDVVVYLVDRDLTGIYELRFSKSSTAAGEALVKILSKSDDIYSRWMHFETQERVNEKANPVMRWYVAKASPVVDAKHPENEKVPSYLYPLFNAFSRMIEREAYYPSLAATYTRASNSTDNVSPAAGETVNEAELMGQTGAPGSDAPDFSA